MIKLHLKETYTGGYWQLDMIIGIAQSSEKIAKHSIRKLFGPFESLSISYVLHHIGGQNESNSTRHQIYNF